MGLLTKTAMVKWDGRTRKHYESKGYIFTKIGNEFEVKVNDLSKGSSTVVEVSCDNPNCKTKNIKHWIWTDYLKQVKEDGKTYCNKCSFKIFGAKKNGKN